MWKIQKNGQPNRLKGWKTCFTAIYRGVTKIVENQIAAYPWLPLARQPAVVWGNLWWTLSFFIGKNEISRRYPVYIQ